MQLVYLIHFDQPYKHAQHYMGSTTDIGRRLAEHRSGQGARLMEVVTKAGITWQLATVWKGGRKLERRLKKRGGHARLCPICKERHETSQIATPTP